MDGRYTHAQKRGKLKDGKKINETRQDKIYTFLFSQYNINCATPTLAASKLSATTRKELTRGNDEWRKLSCITRLSAAHCSERKDLCSENSIDNTP